MTDAQRLNHFESNHPDHESIFDGLWTIEFSIYLSISRQ